MSAIAVHARPPAFEPISPARNTMSTTMAMALALDEGENGHDSRATGTNDASASSSTGRVGAQRPTPARSNTDQILSYYQSEDAGRAYEGTTSTGGANSSGEGGPGEERGREHNPSGSPASTYSSVSDASPAATSSASAATGLSRRRTSTRSSGGSDKRRVAVIEMDLDSDADPDGFNRLKSRQLSSSSTSSYSFSDSSFCTDFTATTQNSSPTVSASPSNSAGAGNTLLTRRGIDGLRFAFIAPPDASPSAYTNLTPPLSAPPQAQHTRKTGSNDGEHRAVNAANTTAPRVASHQRSQSEAVVSNKPALAHSRAHPNRLRKGSRDIGIVGTSISPTSGQMRMDGSAQTHSSDVLPDQLPIFQRPKLSETPSVSYSSEAATSVSSTATTEQTSSGTNPASKLSHSPSKTSSTSASSHPPLTSNNVMAPTVQQTAAVAGVRSPPISPVVVGHTPHQYWQTPALASTGYAHYAIMSQANGTVLSTAQFMPVSSMSSSHSSSSQYPASSSSSIPPPMSSPQAASSPSTNTNLLHYQAGRDATAGPLPPPPRQVIPPSSSSPSSSPKSSPSAITSANSAPPPRPPRLHAPGSSASDRSARAVNADMSAKPQSSAVQGQDRSLTNQPSNASISLRSAGRTDSAEQPATVPTGDQITASSSTMSTLVDSQGEEPQPQKIKTQHAREGAFPPDSIFITQATPPRAVQQQQPLKHKNTMDELVKDVSNAIEEAEARKGGGEVDKRMKRSASVSEGKRSERRPGADLRREASQSTFRSEQAHREPLARIDADRESVQSPASDYSDDPMDVALAKRMGETKPTSNDPFALPPPTSFSAPNAAADAAELRNAKRSLSPQRQLLEFAAKRFSALPRTPSRLSVSRGSQRSSISAERERERMSCDRDQLSVQQDRISLGTPSPRSAKKVYLPKTRSLWPDAMEFKHDVLTSRSPMERSRRYAEKINELANHDSGLGEWVVMMRIHLTQSSKQAHRRSVSPSFPKSPANGQFAPKVRHVSRGSIGSEVTFPKRIDAYVATDLSARPSESEGIKLEGPPPTLPYPSLAQGLTVSAVAKLGSAKSSGGTSVSSMTPSMRSIPLSASSSKGSGGGGFFASIGRKASMKREPTLKSIGNGSSASGPKLLSKRQQQAIPTPRPVQITAQPALPGGPRAPPGRMQRAQSVIAGKTPASSLSPTYAESESELGHRMLSMRRSPSVAPSTAASARGPPPPLPPRDFDKQLAKLADLMPNADKTILAGYLRRAGSDIVAIGQFLEDQKNGCLKRE